MMVWIYSVATLLQKQTTHTQDRQYGTIAITTGVKFYYNFSDVLPICFYEFYDHDGERSVGSLSYRHF